MRQRESAMNPHLNPPSEPSREPSRDVPAPDTLLEGRYKFRSIISWRSRSPAPYGTHTHRAGILAGLALLALAVVSVLLGWPIVIAFLSAPAGALYLLHGALGKPV